MIPKVKNPNPVRTQNQPTITTPKANILHREVLMKGIPQTDAVLGKPSSGKGFSTQAQSNDVTAQPRPAELNPIMHAENFPNIGFLQ